MSDSNLAQNAFPLRGICVHGHFYQPPREDPFTGVIPDEVGAGPYKNWNERIHAECYRPNAELGNFARISFNIGPTLLEWMHTHDPQTTRQIAAQDQCNQARYGVGNAMAQPYHHTILPLARRRDKLTQVRWGIAEFEHRMGRRPQGMWLPETAVDVETLEVLADQGIEFTILAPWQAASQPIDSREPYRVILPDGRSIAVFFYQRELSTAISFNASMTANADLFVEEQVLASLDEGRMQRGEPQLILIASDGEVYGHHKPFRDRFLARLVDGASASREVSSVYPALWLRHHPPRQTVSLSERTSWSCLHGVARWQGVCACTPGDSRWKFFLRQAFDRFADEVDDQYAYNLKSLVVDPWELRNRYIHARLGLLSVDALVQEMAGRALTSSRLQRVRLLLEAQYQRQRMFTSCGWFFEDFDRIEPKNNVAYAAQAAHLVQLATGDDLGLSLEDDLKHVVSSFSGLRGDTVFYRQRLRASQIKH